MSDYSLPRIKESELPEATSIDKVRVLDNAGKSVWVEKENFSLPASQISISSESVEATTVDTAIDELSLDIQNFDESKENVSNKSQDINESPEDSQAYPSNPAVKNYVDTADALKADKATQIIAGAGTTGGGNLSESRTINVVSADDGITVNDDNIKLNIVDDLTTTSATRPLSASQGKILEDNKIPKDNIINDLVTGGTDNVLSAQQGVVIADILNGMGVQNIMYGVEWDSSVTLTTGTRIGNATLHATLPIQSRMRRCILDVSGDVARYLSPSDSTKTDTGYDADLSGAEGDVMVEIPLHYRKFEYEGTKFRCLLSEYQLPGYAKVPKCYISAYEATIDRTVASTPKLVSVVNNTMNYRGGENTSAWDETFRSLLGKPATKISLTNFRTYARNKGTYGRNDAGWNCNIAEPYFVMCWLYYVEYANLHVQETYNATPTAQGYKQGGLGSGVSNLNSTKWSNYNGYNPFIPCGITNSLGNASGTADFTMPFEYDAGIDLYKGVWSAETTYNADEYVSSGENLYKCILESTGNAVTNTTYFTLQVRTTTSVPTYRGVENPYGHIWKWTDGIKCKIQSEADGGKSEYYVCNDPSLYQSTDYTNYEKRGELPRANGYIKTILGGEFGDIMPLATGGDSDKYFADYFYTSIPATGTDQRGVLFGGVALYGSACGLACSDTNNPLSNATALLGSRLCFLP